MYQSSVAASKIIKGFAWVHVAQVEHFSDAVFGGRDPGGAPNKGYQCGDQNDDNQCALEWAEWRK